MCKLALHVASLLTQVLVWSIADHVTTLTATGKMHNAVKGEKLKNRTKLEVGKHCVPCRICSVMVCCHALTCTRGLLVSEKLFST